MIHEVKKTRFLTENAFVLRFDRAGMQFRAGQHIIVGLKGELDQREYSIYSGEGDDFLEILVREVLQGNISVKLKQLREGQELQVNGPFGTFGPERADIFSAKFVFVATGTGISPFHSIIRSYPGIDYTLIHGVRFRGEAYDKDQYDPRRYFLCTSQEGNKERVTGFLSNFKLTSDMSFYICGNGGMIYDVYRILKTKGVQAEKLFSEIYF